jgi:predicted flap endonuclease-1-like 5' DNA nuclease
MGEPMKKTSCQIACVAMGAAAGFVAFVMLMALGGWSFIQAVFGAGVIFVVLSALMAWIFCKPLPSLAQVQAQTATPKPAPKAEAAVASAPVVDTAPTPVAQPVAETVAPAAVASAAATTAAATTAAVVKSGTLLAGEQDLAARKGSWTYQPAPAAAPATAPAAKAKAAPKAKAEPKAKAPAKAKGPAKPATLTAARGGAADNLKEIKGVGPKLEALLHSMGFFHFDQIAGWTAAELAWVDDNLEGFKGRATRDNWVAQAKILASGGETEFSKRVEDGDVY